MKTNCGNNIAFTNWIIELIYYNRNILDVIIEIFEKLLTKEEKSPHIYVALGFSYLGKCFNILDKAEFLVPRDDIFALSRHWPITEAEKSISCFTKVKELDQKNKCIYAPLAICYAIKKDFAEMKKSLTILSEGLDKMSVRTPFISLKKIAFDNMHLRRIEIILSEKNYNHSKFEKEIKKLKGYEDTFSYYFYNYKAYMYDGDFERALSFLKNALSTFPSCALIYDLVGRHYLGQQNYAQAIFYLRTASELYQNLPYRQIESKILHELAQSCSKWPGFNITLYEEKKEELYKHIHNCVELVQEHKIEKYRAVTLLPTLIDIDERISYLRCSPNLLDLKARISNIIDNLESLSESDSFPIDRQLWYDAVRNICSIQQVKLVYMSYLASILDVIENEDFDSVFLLAKLVGRAKSFLRKNDFNEELEAFNRLDSINAKKGNRSFEELSKEKCDSVLQGILLDLGTIDGPFSHKGFKHIESEQQKILSGLAQLREGQQLIEAKIGKISDLFTLGEYPPPERKEMKILTHEGEKPEEYLSKLEQNKTEYSIWIDEGKPEVSISNEVQEKMANALQSVNLLIMLLENHDSLVSNKVIFEALDTKRRKSDSGILRVSRKEMRISVNKMIDNLHKRTSDSLKKHISPVRGAGYRFDLHNIKFCIIYKRPTVKHKFTNS